MRRLAPQRALIVFMHDSMMAATSFVLALYLRLGEDLFSHTHPFLLKYTLLFTCIAASVFIASGLYRRLWRYSGLQDLIVITKAASVSIALFFGLLFLLTRLEGMPRSAPLIQLLLLLAMLGGPRILYRLMKDRIAGSARYGHNAVPVLVVGVNYNAELFLRELERSGEAPYRVVGMVDDDPARIGREMYGIPILAHTSSLPAAIKILAKKGEKPQRILVADERLKGEKLRELFEVTDRLGLPLARLPRLTELKHGIDESQPLRPIAVEDLLGRPQSVHDREGMRALIENKTVMITGAGGSIGSELARQVASFLPASLILLERSEHALYQIGLELAEAFPELSSVALMGDVCDAAQMDRIIGAHKPDLVFHAAAIKHVPIAEDNPIEAARVNVFGTECVARACLAHNVETMVMVSTDKAVNPTSVMGLTKRVAEAYVQALGAERPQTQLLTVRFGNVLGSTGSVVPLFQRQLASGGPLTVTDPQVTRFFMTIREAVELVIQSAVLAGEMRRDGGSHIFVLDMGQPVKIADLARQMIRLAGFIPDEEMQITYTGLRPGEKLHEELFHPQEKSARTSHASLLLAMGRPVSLNALAASLEALKQACDAGDGVAVVKVLHALVPEFIMNQPKRHSA